MKTVTNAPKIADPDLEIHVTASVFYESALGSGPTYNLTLPSVQDLTRLMQAEPARFVSPAGETSEGIRLHDLGPTWRVAEYDHSFIDKRDFPSSAEAFTYVAKLFRKFLHDEFMALMRMHGHQFAKLGEPVDWRYPADLTASLLSASLQRAEARRYVPAVILPSVEERLAYLEGHVREEEFLNDGRGDGSHWEKKGKGYIVRSYERGVCHDEYLAANFREALVRTYALGVEPRYARDRQRFGRMNFYEFSYSELA